MGSTTSYAYGFSAVVVLTSLYILRRQTQTSKPSQPVEPQQHPLAIVPPEQLPQSVQQLLAQPPDCVILQSHVAAFQEALDYSWAQQSREIVPACFVRPRTAQELGQAVAILKREHNRINQAGSPGTAFFTVRSGACNPGIGAAAMQHGVVIDLSLFCEVTPAADGSTVTVGTGAKWLDVYKRLDEKGLIAIGGRNAPVGVGGLTLQGGISFYSPRFGFVCSNAVSYEVVLADGRIVTATATEHPDLWRALKGGGGNFGIVTRFELRCIPSAPVWLGRVIAPARFQETKALQAYHDYLVHASSTGFDQGAAVPIMTFAYIRALPIQIISLFLTYTKAPTDGDKRWPRHWKETGFSSLWSIRRTSNVQSHTSVVEYLGNISPAGRRHMQGTTTIRNNLDGMKAAYNVFCQTTVELKGVKGLMFPFTFQAILPAWMNKGDPNVLGLEGCTEPLVIIGCSVTWTDPKDDDFVRSSVRRMLERIDTVAAANQSHHPYKFMNYSMEFQKPFNGCGDDNMKLLLEASQKYDPDGLFQRGCAGGFKLA